MITEEAVIAALKSVVDPELQINIVDLGLIYDIVIIQKTGVVMLTMTLTSPGCPLSFVFQKWIPDAVEHIDGVKDVQIHLVWEPAWSSDKISDDVKEEMGIIQ